MSKHKRRNEHKRNKKRRPGYQQGDSYAKKRGRDLRIAQLTVEIDEIRSKSRIVNVRRAKRKIAGFIIFYV